VRGLFIFPGNPPGATGTSTRSTSYIAWLHALSVLLVPSSYKNFFRHSGNTCTQNSILFILGLSFSSTLFTKKTIVAVHCFFWVMNVYNEFEDSDYGMAYDVVMSDSDDDNQQDDAELLHILLLLLLVVTFYQKKATTDRQSSRRQASNGRCVHSNVPDEVCGNTNIAIVILVPSLFLSYSNINIKLNNIWSIWW
jgi:hypothetical protein